MEVRVIHITGASGAGTTTLAKAICEKFDYRHLDTDDFFWVPTNPPFTRKRAAGERREKLEKAMDEAGNCVASGSLTEWGDVFIPRFDLVLYVYTPKEVRLERLREREYRRFGSRIMPGGDMHAEHQSFLEWAGQYDAGGMEIRSALHHREWLKAVTCPIIRVDGTAPFEKLLQTALQDINFYPRHGTM